MPTSFWESLRLGFIELRTACAINPPGAPAGRLTAIRDAEATLGNWQLNYHDGIDGSGIAKRFTWHAQSAAARLGFVGEEAEALAFWLDRLLRDAPTQYLIKTRMSASNPSIAVVETIEILDVCGLSAEYCRKCEADEAGSQPVPKLVAKSRMPTESAPISPHGTSDTLADSALIFELLHFQYRYPRGFSSSDQRAVEAVRLEANRRLTETSISS